MTTFLLPLRTIASRAKGYWLCSDDHTMDVMLSPDQAAHIASFSPSTVLLMLDVIEAAACFVPEPQVIQWERREIELRDRLSALRLHLEGGE